MTPIAAIHAAARRYCMDRADFWQRAYAYTGWMPVR